MTLGVKVALNLCTTALNEAKSKTYLLHFVKSFYASSIYNVLETLSLEYDKRTDISSQILKTLENTKLVCNTQKATFGHLR